MGNIWPVVAVAEDNREMIVLGPTKKLFVSLSPSTVSGRSGAEYSKRAYCSLRFDDIRRRGTAAVTFTGRLPGMTLSVAGVINDGIWRHLDVSLVMVARMLRILEPR